MSGPRFSWKYLDNPNIVASRFFFSESVEIRLIRHYSMPNPMNTDQNIVLNAHYYITKLLFY